MLCRLSSTLRMASRQTGVFNARFCASATATKVPEVIASQADFDALVAAAKDAAARESQAKNILLTKMADNDNKRRQHKEKMSSIKKQAISNFDASVETYSKKLESYIGSITTPENPAKEDMQKLIDLMQKLDDELIAMFKEHSIERVNPINEPFNPLKHEALFQVPDATKPENTVVFVMQTGYTIGDRVLRVAKVGTSSK